VPILALKNQPTEIKKAAVNNMLTKEALRIIGFPPVVPSWCPL
jgi:hypothetical protein